MLHQVEGNATGVLRSVCGKPLKDLCTVGENYAYDMRNSILARGHYYPLCPTCLLLTVSADDE